MSGGLKDRLVADMKSAMKAKDKDRLGTIRLALSEIKQREVDSRETLSDADVLGVIDKMVKQRRDSEEQYRTAGRDDLAEVEAKEIAVLSEYLPQQLTAEEIDAAVAAAIAQTGAESMRDMGQVMNALRPQLAGRADMAQVSAVVKSRLG